MNVSSPEFCFLVIVDKPELLLSVTFKWEQAFVLAAAAATTTTTTTTITTTTTTTTTPPPTTAKLDSL
jgi:methylaspartate ammonia-lyase